MLFVSRLLSVVVLVLVSACSSNHHDPASVGSNAVSVHTETESETAPQTQAPAADVASAVEIELSPSAVTANLVFRTLFGVAPAWSCAEGGVKDPTKTPVAPSDWYSLWRYNGGAPVKYDGYCRYYSGDSRDQFQQIAGTIKFCVNSAVGGYGVYYNQGEGPARSYYGAACPSTPSSPAPATQPGYRPFVYVAKYATSSPYCADESTPTATQKTLWIYLSGASQVFTGRTCAQWGI